MTQPARTTENAHRDHATIRDLMRQIQDRLTVPDRATLALGLVGHLATLMNGRQIAKLMDELVEEAERVQDVPPRRRAAREEADAPEAHDARAGGRADERGVTATGRGHRDDVGVQGRGALTGESGPIL